MIYIQQPLPRDMGIDLRGSKISVSQEFLYASEVRSPVQEVGCETVAQGVWARSGGKSCPGQVFFKKPPHTPGGQAGSISIEKQGQLVLALRMPTRKIRTDPVDGHPADWTEPLATPFSPHADQFHLEIEVVKVEPNELADPQATAIEGLEHRPIARTVRRIDGNAIQQSDHIVDPQQARKLPRLLGISQARGRVGNDGTLTSKEAKKRAQARQSAGDGCGGVALPAQPSRVTPQPSRVRHGGVAIFSLRLL